MDRSKLETYVMSMEENRRRHVEQVEYHQRQILAYDGALQFARQLLNEMDSETAVEIVPVGQER